MRHTTKAWLLIRKLNASASTVSGFNRSESGNGKLLSEHFVNDELTGKRSPCNIGYHFPKRLILT
jgi:hypothetical protein